MSLINDALKKAQKQRSGEAPPFGAPGVGGQSARRMSQRHTPAGYGVPYVQIGFGIGIVLLLISGSIFLGRYLLSEPSTPAPVPARPPVVAHTAPAPKPETADPAKPVPLPPNTFVIPIVVPTNPAPAKPAPAPVTTAPTTVVAAPVTPAPPPVVVAKAVPPPAPAPAPVVEPEQPKPNIRLETKAINFIESLRVAGIRASATDSKVLMNDRVYRIGNIIEHDMGLRLTGITANSLTFEDERGASYTRNF